MKGKYSTAEGRWSGFGPYYATFPSDFAERYIESTTKQGEIVLDPFAGRGTALFAAGLLGRRGVGVEINPVGWIFSSVKSSPAAFDDVMRRLEEICHLSSQSNHFTSDPSPEKEAFFSLCFSPRVRVFIEHARETLNWRQSKIDRTLMGFIILYLHGKEGAALSNRMAQTKAMSPGYCLKWWKKHGYNLPPEIDPGVFLESRLRWRYGHGVPEINAVHSILGDSTKELKNLPIADGTVSLLLTSPPYTGMTNYHADQWLRLWALGFNPRKEKNRGRFNNAADYRNLIENVFLNTRKLLAPNAKICVRVGVGKSQGVVRGVLASVFPEKTFSERFSSCEDPVQTRVMGNRSKGLGEVDFFGA